jgi:hypothetical protein
MITNRKHLEIGDILYGYCDGYFGRDSYTTLLIKTVMILITIPNLPVGWIFMKV